MCTKYVDKIVTYAEIAYAEKMIEYAANYKIF